MNSHNKYSRTLLFMLTISMLFASSCAPWAEATEQPTETVVPSATAFVIADTPTPSPARNILSKSTAQPTPTISIERGCLTLEDQLPSDLLLTGVWIRRSFDPYIENLDENTKYSIPLNGGGTLQPYDGYYAISPDQKWLAYLDVQLETHGWKVRTSGYSLKVIHSSGHSLNMNYWPITMQTIYGWIDNQNLLIGFNQRDFILNPFTGKWFEIKKPDWLTGLDINAYSWEVEYSPRLDQVIVWMKDHPELRDASNGNIILSDTKYGHFEKSWSPNGKLLGITANDNQILHIFKEGSEIFKVDLAKEVFDRSLGFINQIMWSPNNKKLLLKTFGNSIIVDIDKQEINMLCFDDQSLMHSDFSRSFFYSSDGKYLVIHLYQEETNYRYVFFDVLVDLDNKRAYKLSTAEGTGRIGWLASP